MSPTTPQMGKLQWIWLILKKKLHSFFKTLYIFHVSVFTFQSEALHLKMIKVRKNILTSVCVYCFCVCVVGEVGDWKHLFNETQNQEMDEKFKECLAGTALGAKLKYESYCQA